MDLRTVGRLIGKTGRSQKGALTVAAAARVGRSTLAALESGKLEELGFAKVERICTAVGVVLEARPTALDAPLMEHRHLTGLRNQRRTAPLETTVIEVSGGRRLRLPTVEEMLRIETFLVVERSATRPYLDVPHCRITSGSRAAPPRSSE